MSVLNDMVEEAPFQTGDLETSIAQVDDQITVLTTQINGIQTELLDVATAALIAYLTNVKMAEFGGDAIVYGPDFGTVNYTTGGITDWHIDSTGVPVYTYLGVGWDDDTSVTTFIIDYDFGNDYLTRPLTTGATYGLIPNRDMLYIAKGILESNKDKIDDSITVFEDYL